MGLLAISSALAAPQTNGNDIPTSPMATKVTAPKFKGINNKHGKTTIKIEIPSSDRDFTNGLSIDDIKLYNNGETLTAKKVDAIWGEVSTVILEFKKQTTFDDCTLSFTLNDKPISMNLQSFMSNR